MTRGYRGKGAQHAQRQYPQTKPKSLPTGSNTAWMTEFIPHLEGLTTPLTTESLLVLPLGATAHEREERLRQLTRMGVLNMRAVRKQEIQKRSARGETRWYFSHYEWTVA